ncbi:MAG: membrane protein insertion efficiency factor YidD [Nocardioides sp.]|nr:membrane protein insertion efficiency factor YidD [Nocardioides sp.]
MWRRVRAYQIHISARRPPVCPMTPTCSRYGLDALSRHGAIRGSWLTWRRIRRCRRPGAYDPVPP